MVDLEASGSAVPTSEYETAWWSAGYPRVVGVDEVGRGALAGPLVAAAVCFDPPPSTSDAHRDPWLHVWAGLRDSKQLMPADRELIAAQITGSSAEWSIGAVEANELDQMGLAAANRIAMERAVQGMRSVDVLLLDAVTIDLGLPQVGIIRGDQHSVSIAAASILAKVYRDRLMVSMNDHFPEYGFVDHKGYGTARHLGALAAHGPTPIHRRCFAPVRRFAVR